MEKGCNERVHFLNDIVKTSPSLSTWMKFLSTLAILLKLCHFHKSMAAHGEILQDYFSKETHTVSGFSTTNICFVFNWLNNNAFIVLSPDFSQVLGDIARIIVKC